MQDLFEAAKEARSHAYCPYSAYQVGSAIRGVDGHIYVGCNVENISFGATICAERMAIGAMIVAGCAKFSEVMVVTKDGGTPCGMCLQVLLELAAEGAVVHVATPAGVGASHALKSLMPLAFQSDEVKTQG